MFGMCSHWEVVVGTVPLKDLPVATLLDDGNLEEQRWTLRLLSLPTTSQELPVENVLNASKSLCLVDCGRRDACFCSHSVSHHGFVELDFVFRRA